MPTSSIKRGALSVALLLPIIMAGCQTTSNAPEASGAASPSPSLNASTPPASSPDASPSSSASPEASPNASSSPEATSPAPSKTSSLSGVSALRLADFKNGWAGGEGWIAHTADSGKTWKVQREGKEKVHQIFALNSKEAWATLEKSSGADLKSVALIHTTDGGTTWKSSGEVPNVDFLHFVNSKEGFSGNAMTADGGATWTRLPAPAKGLVGNVYYHDKSNGWAVTQADDKKSFSFVRTTDGGKSWKQVHTGKQEGDLMSAIIRSAGKDDAWIELIGGSGMTQTAYSLFHTSNGGGAWTPVVANSNAGGGPAPGFTMDTGKIPKNAGNSPGALYVVNTTTALLGGQCQACDNPNTLGLTTNGGKTWASGKSELPGYGPQLIAAADADHVWWLNTDNSTPSNLYTSADGGKHWTKVHSFAKPASS